MTLGHLPCILPLQLVQIPIRRFRPTLVSRLEATQVWRQTRLTLVIPKRGALGVVSLLVLVHRVRMAFASGEATRYPCNRLLTRVIRTLIEESRYARSWLSPCRAEPRVLSRPWRILRRDLVLLSRPRPVVFIWSRPDIWLCLCCVRITRLRAVVIRPRTLGCRFLMDPISVLNRSPPRQSRMALTTFILRLLPSAAFLLTLKSSSPLDVLVEMTILAVLNAFAVLHPGALLA